MIVQEIIHQLRTALLERQKQILEQLENFEEGLACLEQSRPPEFSEEAQEVAAAINLQALTEQERRELTEIRHALSKLDKGAYGICERCESAIDVGRLKALPSVRYCIKCQTRLEQGARD